MRETNTDAILTKNKNLQFLKLQEVGDLELKFIPYNIYLNNGNKETTYGQHQMTIQTYADTQAANLPCTDMNL